MASGELIGREKTVYNSLFPDTRTAVRHVSLKYIL
jgi:hypothetical protein